MDKRLHADLEALFAMLLKEQGFMVRRQLQARKGQIFAAAEKVLGPRYQTFCEGVNHE